MEKVEQKNGIQRAVLRVRKAWGTLADYRCTTVAGTLAFFFIISVVPFLFWATLLFGGAGITAEDVAELAIFGWAKDFLLFLQNNAQEGVSSGVSVFFLVTTLWSSSSFFYHLRRSGELIYGCRRPKHGLKVRLSALFLTLCVLLYFAVAGGALFAVLYFGRALRAPFRNLIVYAAVFVVGFFAAWILNAYVCPYKISPASTVLGSALTALFFLAASGAFAVYLHFSNAEKLYGALSLVIVFLFWLYWIMVCFTAGVIFNRSRLKTLPLEHKTL